MLTGLRMYAALGSILLVLGLIGGVYVWHKIQVRDAYNRGVMTERKVWEALALQAKIDKLNLELQVQKDADAQEEAAKAELEKELAEITRERDEYIQLNKDKRDCRVGPNNRGVSGKSKKSSTRSVGDRIYASQQTSFLYEPHPGRIISRRHEHLRRLCQRTSYPQGTQFASR